MDDRDALGLAVRHDHSLIPQERVALGGPGHSTGLIQADFARDDEFWVQKARDRVRYFEGNATHDASQVRNEGEDWWHRLSAPKPTPPSRKSGGEAARTAPVERARRDASGAIRDKGREERRASELSLGTRQMR